MKFRLFHVDLIFCKIFQFFHQILSKLLTLVPAFHPTMAFSAALLASVLHNHHAMAILSMAASNLPDSVPHVVATEELLLPTMKMVSAGTVIPVVMSAVFAVLVKPTRLAVLWRCV